MTRLSALIFLSIIFVLGILANIFIYNSAVDETSHLLEECVQETQRMLFTVQNTAKAFACTFDKFGGNEQDRAVLEKKIAGINPNVISCEIIMTDTLDRNCVPYKGYWTNPTFDGKDSSNLVSSFILPLYDADDKVIGIIKSDVLIEGITDKITKLKPYKHTSTFLIAKDGSFISHTDKKKVLSANVFNQMPENRDEGLLMAANKLAQGESGVIHYKQHFYITKLLSNGWSVIVKSRNSDVLWRVRVLSSIFALISIIGLIILYIYSSKRIARQTKPITALAYASLNIAQGNFKAMIPEVETEDEIKRLRDSLCYIESSFQSYIKELRSTTASKERFESELGIANSIQMQMLSKDFDKVGCLDLYADLIPAKEVGGDFYDFFQSGDNVYFAVGDVSGKGVPAALYMAITRSAFRFNASLDLPLDKIVTNINHSFFEVNKADMFVTLFIGRLNTKTGELKYCNAGHNPILIVGPDGKARYLSALANLAAGLIESFRYVDESTTIDKGSRLVLYTDGVTEAENASKELYGEDRLTAFAQGRPLDENSQLFCENLIGDIRAFTKEEPQNDDITIMSIRV